MWVKGRCSCHGLAWPPFRVPYSSQRLSSDRPWFPGQCSPGSQKTHLRSAGAAARGPENLGVIETCLTGGGGGGLCSLGNQARPPESIHHHRLQSRSAAGGPRRVAECPPPWAASCVTDGTDGGSDGRPAPLTRLEAQGPGIAGPVPGDGSPAGPLPAVHGCLSPSPPRRGPHCRASSPHSPSHWGQDCSLWRWGHDLVHTQHVPTVSSAPSSHPWALPWSPVAEWTPAGGPSLSGLSGPRGWQAGSLWTSRVTSLARHLLTPRSLPASPRAPWASPALHSRNPPPVVVRKRTLLGQMDKHTGQRLLSSRPQALKPAPEGMWRGPIWAPTPTNNFIMGLEATSL